VTSISTAAAEFRVHIFRVVEQAVPAVRLRSSAWSLSRVTSCALERHPMHLKRLFKVPIIFLYVAVWFENSGAAPAS
jgi:hypothetical protein